MSHMSHFYPYGTNLYFIFGIKGQLEDYVAYRTGLIDAMVTAGGSPSHHHGVGRLMQPWIEMFLGKQEMDVLRDAQASLRSEQHHEPRRAAGAERGGGRTAVEVDPLATRRRSGGGIRRFPVCRFIPRESLAGTSGAIGTLIPAVRVFSPRASKTPVCSSHGLARRDGKHLAGVLLDRRQPHGERFERLRHVDL